MLTKGASGSMVFEPAFVKASPGDTLVFLPSQPGHNVETIDGMIPAGAEAFKSPFNKEFRITLAAEGGYGLKCTPHYAMGMVAVVDVGDNRDNLEAAQKVKHPAQAEKRFAPLLGQVD